MLASFIYELFKHSNKGNAYVGYVEAAQGTIILVVSLPIGFLADKFSKSLVIRAGAICIPIAAAATIFAAVYGVAHESPQEVLTSYYILFGAMCMWGLGYAIYGGPVQALLADSTPTGQRSWYYTKNAQIGLVAQATGPLVAIAMFLLHGDRWRAADLRNVLVTGVALELPMAILMLLFRDDCALDEDEEASATGSGGGDRDGDLVSESAQAAEVSAAEAVGGGGGEVAAMPPTHVVMASSADASSATEESPQAAETAETPTDVSSHHPHIWALPYVLFSSSVAFALGSGMTVKFFPLFFKNDLRLSPVAVQSIYLILPLLMAWCSGFAERAAKTIGRVTVLVGFKCVGISLLITMAVLRDWVAPGGSHPNATAAWNTNEYEVEVGSGGSGGGVEPSESILVRYAKTFLMVAIYLVRTVLMNATYPIEEAILMDYVPKSTRARWKALDSISAFGWCGSAALGGLIADKYDYSTTFLATASLQALGTLMFSSLWLLIPRSADVETREATTTTSGVEPLVCFPEGSIQAGAVRPAESPQQENGRGA